MFKPCTETSRTEKGASEMSRDNIKILRLSETRWEGNGRTMLTNGFMLLHSGLDEECKQTEKGVAIIIIKQLQEDGIGYVIH